MNNTRITDNIHCLVNVICDVIIDFLTTNPEQDIKIACAIMNEFEKLFNLQVGSFQLKDAKALPMGWSRAKLFLSLELAQKLYENNSYQIDTADRVNRSQGFVSWLNTTFRLKGCNARLQFADDMKNTSGGSRYSSNVVTIFSDEFYWSR